MSVSNWGLRKDGTAANILCSKIKYYEKYDKTYFTAHKLKIYLKSLLTQTIKRY